jgi:hypothetical protein
MQIDGGISCIGVGPYCTEKRGKNEIETVWGVCFTSVCLSPQILHRSDPATKLRVLLEGVVQLSQVI